MTFPKPSLCPRRLLQVVACSLGVFIGALAGGQPTQPAPQAPAGTNSSREFRFPSGSPAEFLAALEKHYQADLLSVATIPAEMESVRVPRLRIAPGSMNSLYEAIKLYNRLGDSDPRLGRWMVDTTPEGGANKPSVVLLKSGRVQEQEPVNLRTRVLPVGGIPEKRWPRLVSDIKETGAETIALEREQRMQAGATEFANAPFSVRIHAESMLLLVTGPDSLVELADSIVQAYHANAKVGASPAMFSILGAVNRPGIYPLPESRSMSILEAVASAGGFAKSANTRKIEVTNRTSNGETLMFKMELRPGGESPGNLYEIKPNDVIFVPENVL